MLQALVSPANCMAASPVPEGSPTVVMPELSTLNRVEVTEAAVVEPMANNVDLVSPGTAWIESLAKGVEVPIPTLPEVSVVVPPIIVRAARDDVAVPATVGAGVVAGGPFFTFSSVANRLRVAGNEIPILVAHSNARILLLQSKNNSLLNF